MAIGTPIVRAIDIDPVLTRSAGVGEATGHAPAAHHGGRGLRSPLADLLVRPRRRQNARGSAAQPMPPAWGSSAPPCRRSSNSCLVLAWLVHPKPPCRMPTT